VKRFFQDQRPHRGFDYDEYVERMRELTLEPITGSLDEITRGHLAGAPINLQRTTRILKTYTVPEEARSIVRAVKQPQLWMVITEPWCGDSAQCLPYVACLAECNTLIRLKLLFRDMNPDIMDEYLTDGTRGIPKLVAFDRDGNELFQWGPRPREAQDLFLRARAEGLTKPEALERLHLWYGRNRGSAVVTELLALIKTTAGVGVKT
jgi:hypothetical protein